MPKFIKMGLGGTGYLGHPSSHKRAAARRSARRKVNEGFPWNGKFQTPEQLERYFASDELECLICGSCKRKLGMHIIKIHDISLDEYKERFGIPYTYGLCGAATREVLIHNAKERIDAGDLIPGNAEQAKIARESARRNRARPPVRDEHARRNLEKINATPRSRTWDSDIAHKGTPEFHEKMRSRKQCATPAKAFVHYWDGKKQTQEHVEKRLNREARRIQAQS